MDDPLITKLRYMARQYTNGSLARGGNPGRHYLDEAADEIERLRAVVAQQAEPSSEFCWLVELFEGDGTGDSAGWYHTGFIDIGGRSRTTKHVHEARRYGSREHAERIAAKLGTTLTGTWRAVEHGFHAAPRPQDSTSIHVEAVGRVLVRDGGNVVDWLVEGGAADLEPGELLMISDQPITDNEGSGDVYLTPPAPGITLDLAQKIARDCRATRLGEPLPDSLLNLVR